MYSREREPGVRQGKSWTVEVPRKMSVASTQDGRTPEELGGRGGSWAGLAGPDASGARPTGLGPWKAAGGSGLPRLGGAAAGQSRVEGAGTAWRAAQASRGSSCTWQGEEERGRLCRAGEAGEDRAAPMRAVDRDLRAGRTPSPGPWPFAMRG